MTAPTGCHTCGGGAGRHDEAAHSDWPAEVDHRPYWNEVLEAEYCVGDGTEWPCLAHRETATLPPYSRKPITLPDGTPVIGWSGLSTPEEEWRAVPGHPDYQVSSLGRVVSRKSNNPGGKPYLMRGVAHPRGYRQVFLRTDGRHRNAGVHQIVAEAFIGPRPDGMEVRHLDGDKSNNALSNLVYGTHSENMQDQVRHGVHNSVSRRHCRCGHAKSTHGTDRRGRAMCWSAACGCASYRPQESK